MTTTIRHAIMCVRRRDGGLEIAGAPVSMTDWEKVVNYVRSVGIPEDMRVHDVVERIRAGKYVSRQDCVSAVVYASAKQHFADPEGKIRTILVYAGTTGAARTVRIYGYHELLPWEDTSAMMRVAGECDFLARNRRRS